MTEIVDVSPVSEKGQVTIPKEIRKILDVKPGDRVAFINDGTDIIVKKAKTRRLSEMLVGQKHLKSSSLGFQRKARQEWT